MLTCRELTEQASDYLDGSAPFWGRTMFRIHLGMCRHCKEFVRQLELTTAVLRSGALEPAPVGKTEPGDDVVRAFRAEFGGGEDS